MFSLLLAFFCFSITVSFLCSLWEAVLLSITPSYMQIKLNEGGKTGKILKEFKNNIDRPLAGILTLNTMAHTIGAIGVGQQAALMWEQTNPLLTALVVPIAMTAAILILSEIIPKTIGATNWKALVPFTVSSLNIMLTVLAPIIWLCQLVTKMFHPKQTTSVFSRNDLLALAQIGTQEGQLDEAETKFIHNLLLFKSYRARDVMTPRTVVVSAPQNMSARLFYNLQDELVFSRIPLRDSPESENIVGYVLKDEVLEHLIDDAQDKPLSEFCRPIITIPDNYTIFKLFNDFIAKREHIALVVDEFGAMAGVITMEDVIETLLGAEIVDETDRCIDMQSMALEMSKNQWKNRYKK